MRNKVNRALVAKKKNVFSQKNHSEENLNLFRYATMVVVLLFAFGYSDAWASSDYARGFAKVSSSSPSGAGKVYVAYTSSGGTQPATPAAGNSSWKTSEASAQAEGSKTTFDFYYYSLPTSGYALEGWSETDGASDYSNEAVAKYSIKTSSSTANDAYTDVRLYAHFVPNPTVTVTFLAPDSKCTYTVTCDGANVAVGSSKTTNKSFNLAVTVNDANYKLLGWYTTTDGGVTKSYFSPNSTYTNKYFPQTCSVGVDLVEAGKPVFMVRDKLFTDLNAANTAAGGSGTIVLVSDGLLDVGNYTISSGNTLLIPHTIGSTFVNAKSVIDAPYIVKTAAPLSAFRKLTLQDGVNITVNGKICVAGKMMSSGGGKASAYPTGELGIIDMSRGGHIELNSGAIMYVWGFIKGQDMDQGNNTTGAGTITANAGSVVWEGFATGDWRGGSASSTLYDNASSWKFFPFQSYTIQNIEVPVTYNYNSKLSNYMSIFGDGQVYNGTFDLIGSSNTLFLLKNSSSKLKKWYDPTTDLVCYEMSGSTQLDALNVDAAGETVSSKDYNLPISTSMHIIMASSTTISKPVEIQAGAVIEIKSGATVTCSSNVYLFDKDQWGEYCNSKYYYTMTNLSIHKDRGDGKSNAMIDDAKLIIDGTLNVTGKLYTTSGGADIMGNGGGKISFSNLGSSTNIVMCTGVSTNENVAINQGCLHNEDESYTKAIASTTFHNVNGRWFKASSKDEKANHTYDFTYISSGAVSGTGGTNTTTDAVYSWDKTGLELRQKWFNVTADCNEGGHYWWHGQGEQTTWFYNWTLNDTWHQFIPTATPDLYSASNNTLYTKTSCTWEELGSTDVNCLYEIGGVKKALVEGEFVALEPNNNDPAYHAANDASQYYICFSGCNWHAADKYTEAEKAYTVESETFIWYNNAWMSVNFQEQFAYTIDETNVPVYYEYVDGEWVLAAPYVRVVDGIEDRSFWFLADAFKFASSALRTSPTITILRDVSATTAVSYTGANKTCTLDLNGHTITGSVTKMLNINAAGCTFIITDNTELKQGKISMSGSENARLYAVAVTDGTLILENGTIFGENTQEYVKDVTTSTAVSAVYVAAGKTFTMNNGMVHAKGCYAARGVDVAGSASANATVNINKGTVTAETTQVTYAYGIYAVGGTINVKNNTTINATSKTTTAYGIYIDASTKKYYGTLNMTGGTVNVTNLTSGPAGGVFVQGVHIMSNVSNTTPNTIASSYLGVANISGGTFTVKNSSKTTGYGIYSLGNTTVSGSPVFNVTTTTTTAYGLFVQDGTTTINGTPTFNVKGTEIAYGVYANGATPANKSGRPYNPLVTVNGGTFNVQTTSKTTAYGIYVDGNTRPLTSTASGYYQGNYASAGNVIVNGGIFNVTAKTTKSYGVVVAAPKEEAGATEYDPVTANPKATINGGYFRMAGTGGVNAVNDLSTTDNLKVNGGYYSHDGNLATYTPSPKHVLTLTAGDANRPPYYYKVAEAYLVTFKNEDGTADIIDPVYQEKGTKPVCSTEPTKASTTTNSFTFDGWATSAGGAKVYEKNALPNVTGNVTYYAHFATTTLKYRVHLDVSTNDGVCDTENIYVEPGETIGTSPTATKYGYTFSGWFTAATGGTQLTSTTVINADAEYFAQFTVNTYTLTWVLDGGKVTTAGTAAAKNATGSPSGEVAYDAAITVPVVGKTGYVFANWTPAPATKMPAEAATYTAHWNPATNTVYTVKHYLQSVDGTYPADPTETQSLTGTTATSVTPAVKSYEGFVSPSAQTVTIAADGSTVVTYQYARRHYTFTLDAATNGGTSDLPSIEVIHGATIGAVPPDAQKGCNDFTGWYTKAVGGVKITSAFVIEYDMKTLYAQFSDDIRTYPITYLPGENGTGTVTAGSKTCGGEAATLSSSTFTRIGYTQTGWSTSDGGAKVYELGGSYTANAALTLYPFWTVNQYTISFNSNGGSEVASITQDYNTSVTSPVDPTKTGYTFNGWSPDVPNTMPAENTECVAQWTANNYTITYKDQGDAAFSGVHGDGYPTTHTYDATTALVDPTKTGYTFDGWYTLSDCASGLVTGLDATAYTANITLYAKWTANTYEVTLNPNSGSGGSASVTMTYNSSEHTAITNPTRTGYTFHSWNTTTSSSTRKIVISSKGVMSENVAGYTGAGGVWIRTTMPTTLYARWTENTYAITFTHNGNGSISFNGSVVAAGSTAKVYYHTAKALVATPNTGYHFTGWTKSGTNASKVTIADMSAASTTIKATAKNATVTAGFAPDEYTITYKDQGDVAFSGVHGDGYPTTHTYGTTTALVNPTKAGYAFEGWYDNADCTGAALTEIGTTAYTTDFTLYAKWTINQYTISFNSDGGSDVASITQDYNSSVSAPADPTKTGYTFAGWSPEVPSVMPAEDTECVAQWTPNTNTPYVVKHYQQNLDGTYPSEPTDTDNETGTTDTEVTPAVKNYTGFTAPDAQSVTVLADGSRVVTYQYMRNSYNLSWNSNGGELSGSYTSGLVLFGTTITAPTANRANYDFDGWNEEPAATMPAEDKTYTAQWSLSAVTILWKSEDGSETLETDNLVLIGAAPSFDGTEPTKATTESYTYTFDGWTTEANGAGTFYAIGELPTVSAAATYYAHFTATANVASVKVGSTTTYYTTIDAAFAHVNTVSTNMTITLLADATAAASLVYQPKSTYTCTLDLNNHTISGAINKLIDINLAKSTFIITDNSVAKGGSVSTTLSTNARLYSVFLTAGTLKLQNGKIYANNPYKYSSGKSCAATGVYVTAGQTFTMENGTVESASQYASYAIYMARGTSTVTIKNGLVKGRTTKSTTAAGIYNLGKGLTINGGRIVGHAYTTTAYGIYLNGGHGTINGGTIEATNDTTDNKGSTTTYGIYVNYYNGTYKGVLTIPSTSTVEVFAKARTNTSYAIVVGGGSTGNTIAGGTFTAKTKTGKTAYCVNSSGNITISGGTFTAYAATTNAYGLYSARGTITVNGDPTFNVTAGSTTAYGALAYGTIGKKGTGKYSGTIEINGGTFNVTSTAETAWGAYAGLASRDLRSCSATNDTVPGLHYMPGILVVNDGTFNVKATTTGAFGIVVAKAKSESGTVGTTARIPLGTVTGGKFKVESMGDANATAYAMNSATTAARLVVQGGYYNTKRTDASETSNIEDKYTAPTLSNNYRVLDLPEEELPYKYKVAEAYNLTWDAAGGELSGLYTSGYTAVGDPITVPTATRTDYDFSGWNESPAATMPASDKTYTATWTLAETGDYLDIVDWTASTLTINANGWAASGWPYTINGTAYEKEDRAADRTLTIPYSGAAGTDLQIKVESGGSTTSLHNYKIPYINTTSGTTASSIVYVNSGTLTIDGSTTLAALYVRPEASVDVTSGTLTVGKLVLRTLPWQAAAISGNFTATETYYTRIAPNKRTISGPDGEITYESARYYQFALPLNCTAQMKDIQVSNAANTPYGNTWLLKRYNEETRAENGAGADNWVALGNEDYIQGGVGYEMFSNSNYYREFYFPLGAVNSGKIGTRTAVSYHLGSAGEKHAGWNIICSPLMSTYTNSIKSPEDLETALKISELMTDGSYWQHVPEEIPAAIPFSYQASNTGDYLYFNEISLVQKIVRRAHTAAEPEHIQWLNLFVKDDNGRGDETSILTHPTRYEDTYKTGIDVAKQSYTASRALIYSSHAYGEMAFAGVRDELLEKGVPLTLFSPAEKELTFSMRENDWLDRMEYVWLIDKETGARTDLLVSDYTFTATEGTIEGRFVIEGQFHAPQVTTGLDEGQSDNGVKVRKIMVEDKIFIQINDRTYDATGKLVNGK